MGLFSGSARKLGVSVLQHLLMIFQAIEQGRGDSSRVGRGMALCQLLSKFNQAIGFGQRRINS